MVVDDLDEPGLRIDDIAVGHPGLTDFVPAGHDVLDVDDAVLVGHVGPRLVGGIGGLVAVAQIADGELHIGQGLVGDRVVLGDQETLTGMVFRLDQHDRLAVGADDDLPLVGVCQVVAGGRGNLREFVGTVGEVLEQQFAVLVGNTVSGNHPVRAGRLGVFQGDGLQVEVSTLEQPAVGRIVLTNQQVPVRGVLEDEFQDRLVGLKVLGDREVAALRLEVLVVARGDLDLGDRHAPSHPGRPRRR